MEWLISSNNKIYDPVGAFKKWGFIDWRQKANYNTGDIIYIYCTAPLKKVMFKTKVEKINMSFNETVDDKIFWTNPSDYYNSPEKTFSRLRLTQYINSDLLTLEILKNNGLKTAPQGPIKINRKLSNYMENIFNTDPYNFIDDSNESLPLIEGKTTTITINSIERNRLAREECIKHFGFSC